MLALGIAAGTTTFAGCSAFEDGPSVELSQGFAINNASRDDVTVNVKIGSDGATHYDSTHTVEATDYESQEDSNLTRINGIRVNLDEWSHDSAAYTVQATVGDTNIERNIAEDWPEDCVVPQIYVPRGGDQYIHRHACESESENPSPTTESES